MPGIGGSSPTIKQVNDLTPQQSDLFNQFGNYLSGQIGQGVPAYTGEISPGASSLQNQSFGGVSDMLSTGLPSYLKDLAPLQQPWNVGQATQQWNQQVGGPAMTNFDQNVVPKVMEQFAGYGAANSGGASRALAEAGTNLTQNLAGSESQFMQNSQQNALANILKSVGLGSQITQQGLDTGLAAGGQQRGITQQQDTAAYQEFIRTQAQNNPMLQYLLPFVQTKTFDNVGIPGQQSGAGGLLGGLGSILGGLGGGSGGGGGGGGGDLGVGAAFSALPLIMGLF